MDSPAETPVEALPNLGDMIEAVAAAGSLCVLTGAGISTESGIPAYRDESGTWVRSPPIRHQAFLSSDAARRRYWARSMAGWPLMAAARPNAAHRALAALEQAGRVTTLITQNVDGLHQQAGSRAVIDLHGRLDGVVCLDCRRPQPRRAMQDWLEALNPEGSPELQGLAPDGDAEVDPARYADFRVPSCPACGGVLKPDVVFYGDAVPRPRVDAAMATLAQAGALLVAGSSLMVYSGYRFCLRAQELGKPLLILNRGVTRADELAALRLDAPCGAALEALAAALA
jgi:NAD-dependent SIR2 family protein deacetylase